MCLEAKNQKKTLGNGLHNIFLRFFNLTTHFYLNSHAHVVMFSLQFSGIQNRPPKAWQSHPMGSGGHQTDSKPASVLTNKPQLRGKQVYT